MPKSVSYSDEQILFALICMMPRKLTKGQVGRVLDIKSAGQKHWADRFSKLAKRKLLSVDELQVEGLFKEQPIRRYFLTEHNLKTIWNTYFVHVEDGALTSHPFLIPFSKGGAWNLTSSPQFAEVVGSKFNYFFLCAKNTASHGSVEMGLRFLTKDKLWKLMDAVLSIAWKIEAYSRKPELLNALSPEQKKAFKMAKALYEDQKSLHPREYAEFSRLFEKNFRSYL